MTNPFQGPYWIDPHDPTYRFPDVELAMRDPDGLLAIGGDLSTGRLLQAYRRGIFPWYSEGQPILWWCPDPRAVLFIRNLKISRSLRKSVTKSDYRVTMDTRFTEVVNRCAAPRDGVRDTWITAETSTAYRRLHELGAAHSVEYWRDDKLLGGLYGVAMDRMFFGESMFSGARDASKVALVYLCNQLHAWGFPCIDCQIYSAHLGKLGATPIPRKDFMELLHRYCKAPALPGTSQPWDFDPGLPERVRASGGGIRRG